MRIRSFAKQGLLGAGLLLVTLLIAVFAFCLQHSYAYAEGSADLTENSGYRSYTERYGATTSNVERQQLMWLEVNAGEHVLLGTSVWDVALNRTDKYKDSEIHIKVHASGDETSEPVAQYRISVDTDGKGYIDRLDGSGSTVQDTQEIDAKVGCIENQPQEAAGPNLGTTGAGYNPVDIVAPVNGLWEVEFYSTKLTSQNPTMTPVGANENFQANQKGGTIAAWDITATNADKTQTYPGRVYTHKLFLNMGGNRVGHDVLNAKVWVYTDDGFSYATDFNGMDPYGFIFFANNRGLLYQNADGSTQSLYHSVLTRDNQMNGLAEHNILLNLQPQVKGIDSTYKIFFNEPDSSQYPAATATSFSGGGAQDLSFMSTSGMVNQAVAGEGGTFSFDATDPQGVTSYKLKLTFEKGSPVTLGNNLKPALNSIVWDGKDGDGILATAENYIKDIQLEFSGGEVHFPMMDVENSHNGIKIQNVTPGWQPENQGDTWKLYFDNINDDPSKFSTGWSSSINNWTSIAGGGNYAATGISSADGAMKYSSNNQFVWANTGNQAALDLWTYVSSSIDITAPKIDIKDKPCSLILNGAKNLSGRDPVDGEFEFVVAEQGQTVVEGKNDATGNITFPAITYATAGEHTYIITETRGPDTHITYDPISHTVKVVVADADGDGVLEATVTYETEGDSANTGAVFNNSYTLSPTTYTISATKNLVNQGGGNQQLQPNEFTFKLLDAEKNTLQTVPNDAQGTIKFPEISYSEAGTYTYYVQEVAPSGEAYTTTNWVFDTSPHAVEVVVTDNGGNLVATANMPEGGIEIKNLYREDVATMNFWGTKQLQGRALKAGEFEFGLYLKSKTVDGSVTPGDVDTPIGSTVTNDEKGCYRVPGHYLYHYRKY